MDTLDSIIRYEEGELDDTKTVELFQHLLDRGQVWLMQGHYGRTAKDMIENGLIFIPKTGTFSTEQ